MATTSTIISTAASRIAATATRLAAPSASLRPSLARSLASARDAAPDQDSAETLPFFTPKPALAELPNVRGATSQQLEMRPDSRAKLVHRELMRAVDLEHRVRHDTDGRTQLFSRESPTAIKVGSIVLVEYVSSRSKARRQFFSGVLIQIRRNGMMSAFVLRTMVIGTGVEMLFPLYSPMVIKIRVLQPPSPDLKEADSDDITWVRTKGCPGVDYTKIDEMVARYRSAQDRLEKRMRIQQQHLDGQN